VIARLTIYREPIYHRRRRAQRAGRSPARRRRHWGSWRPTSP